MPRIKTLIAASLLGGLVVSGSGVAEDTEIYFGTAGPTSAARPNVLFVLDTSSSMNNLDGGSTTRLDRMKQALHNILDSSTNINVGLMRFHRIGGPVLYPVSYIDADADLLEGNTGPDADVVARIDDADNDAEEDAGGTVLLNSDKLEMGEIAAGTPTTVTVRVSTGTDDAEERLNDNSMYLTSSDLEMPKDGSRFQAVGVRFQNVNIPPGATITSAEIEFEIDETKSGDDKKLDLNIRGQAADNPGTFTSTAGNITSRPTTTAVVTWSDVPFPAVNDKLTTPDLSTIVSEIVSRPGWASGNSMVFIIEKSTGAGNRTVESYDGEPAAAPLLRITYTVGTAGTQTVGLRFTDVGIPQGAVITSAQIEFTAGNIDSDDTKLEIKGEAADNSAPFTSTNGDLSGRSLTTAQVQWDSGTSPPLAAWDTTDVSHATPDLKAIVQEIVNRGGWCGGNAMTFLVTVQATSVGKRAAYSYDTEASKAPLLKVNFDYDPNNPPPGATGCINQTVTSQVLASNDDAEQRADNSMYLNSSDLELVTDGSPQKVGIRFRNIQVPQGATIISADIVFTTDETSSGTTSVTFYGHDTDNAPAFSSTAGDISNRTKTTASVAWNNIPAWNTVGETHTSPDLTSIVQEIVNRTGWTPGNAMAFIIEGSGRRVAESYDGDTSAAPRLRIKFVGTAAGGTTTITTVRQRLKNIVDELQYKTGTPILSTLVEAAWYYRGQNVFYGLLRGDQGSRSEFTRVSHFLSYCEIDPSSGNVVTCNGANTTGYPPYGVNHAAVCDTNPNDPACKTETIEGTPTYISPITADCQASYIILLSDGQGYISDAENTGSINGQSTEPTQYVHQIVGNNNCSGHDACAKDLVAALKNNDQNTVLAGNQTITTYTIGFNLNGDPQFLKDLAAAGGGAFYEASSAEELTAVFQSILSDIVNAPTSFTAPALSVNAFNRLFNRDEVYLALFRPENTVAWPGNIKKYKLCSDSSQCTLGELLDANGVPAVGLGGKIKDSAQSLWSSTVDGATIEEGGAGSKIPTHTNRVVYTYTGTDDSPASPVALSAAAHLVQTSNAALTKTLLGDPGMTDAYRDQIINWMRGQDVIDEDGDTSTTDDRWAMADPLHARPVPVTYGAVPDANGDPDPDKPIIKLLVATNDGALRMINATNGIEEWIFYAPELLPIQKDLMENGSGSHLYGLDGNPEVWIQDKSVDSAGNLVDQADGVIDPAIGDFVRVIVGMRRGGRNLYALDITPASKLTSDTQTTGITPKFMWRIKGGSGDFASLGQSWSTPIVTRIRVGKSGGQSGDSEAKTVLILGGGYDSAQDALSYNASMQDEDEVFFGTDSVGNAIYIIDPADGSRFWWASNSGSGADLELAGMDYSVPGDIAPYDSNGDGETDRIYFTDVGGQVWRIDLSPTLKKGVNAGSTGGLLATLSDNGANPAEADKRKMFYSVDVVPVRDTQYSIQGEYDIVTVVTGNRSHPLDLDVHNRVYALRDYLFDQTITMDNNGNATNYPQCYNSGSIGTCTGPLTTANLYDASSNALQGGGAQSEIDSLTASTGWYFDLKESDGSWIGEKGLSKPVTLNGIMFFTTFIPTQSGAAATACSGSEGTGRVFAVNVYNASAVLDFNDSGSLSTADRFQTLGGGIPSEVVPVFQEEGVTILVGTSAGARSVQTGIGLPRERTFWYQK